MRLAILIVITAGVMSLATQQCEAQVWGGFGTPYMYGAGYGLYVYERIPQYSLFPPVYYKHPVPRAYGYSPYAYPPGFTTPPVSSRSPQVVVLNPFVPQPASASQSASSQPQPLVIQNPYVRTGAQLVAPAPKPADTVASGG